MHETKHLLVLLISTTSAIYLHNYSYLTSLI